MLKRFILTLSVVSILGAPMAYAQGANEVRVLKHSSQKHAEPAKKKPQAHNSAKKHYRSGQKLDNWKRYQNVDHKKHKLRAPAKGQKWVQIDNQYALITAATGLIVSLSTVR